MSDAGLPVTTVTKLPAVSLQRVPEVIHAHGIAPKSAIINELFEADVMGQRDDGIVVYHPIIQSMMTTLPASLRNNETGINNVVALSIDKRGAA